MREIVLRPYQVASIEGLRAGIRAGHRSQVLVAPTGAGKTLMAAALMDEARKKGTRVAFVVDRVALVDQTSATLDDYSIPHGVVQADHWRRHGWEQIQICSAQTLEKRGFFPDLKMLVVDEAHCMRQATIKLIQNVPRLIVVGLTATPLAPGMSSVYSNVVNVVTTNQLVRDGFLVPLTMYAARAIDMTGAKVVAGEWAEKEIEQRGNEIVGDIVAEWVDKTMKHFNGPVKTIVFSATVDHGEELCRQFQASGYNFQQISYKDTNDERRRELIEEFRKPDSVIDGLVSCEVLSKGFDVPDVLCGISARPYRKSLSSHIQQLGRVMRPAAGKSFGLWLCVARGSRVLTNRGLVPIEEVSRLDKIWDGVSFVAHGGAVCNGKQKTIRYQGLEATPGHLVHTAQGWRTFGDCARQQIAITKAGVGGAPIRAGEDHLAGHAVARSETSAVHSCGLRVRDVRVSSGDFARQFGEWAHWWMQALWTACAGVPAVAIRSRSSDACALPEPKGRSLSAVRRAWDRIPIRWRQSRDALDHEAPGRPAAGFFSASGPHRPGRALRTREHSLAQSGAQPTQQVGSASHGAASQIPDGTSGNSVRRQHVEAAHLGGDGYGADYREVQQAFVETEREVWDILDCGPRNRFTCEGLLVHNCHSGNALRFKEDTDRIFAEGFNGLDDGELESKQRKEPTEKEKEQIKCAGCGFILPASAKVCPACGKERVRRSLVDTVAGEMVALGHNGKPLPAAFSDKHAVWAQLTGYALARKNDDDAARRFALAQFKNIYGHFPKGDWNPAIAVDPTIAVANRVRSNLIRFAKARRAA